MFLVVKKGYVLLILALAVLTFISVTTPKVYQTSEFVHLNKKTVVIDAGHGAPDGGAVGKSGTIESEINLSVAKKLTREMAERGYTVIMTREGERGIYDDENASIREKKRSDLVNRVKIANSANADMLVSIHMNNFLLSKYRGAEVLYSPNFSQSLLLAELIQSELTAIDPANQTRTTKLPDKTVYLLQSAEIPAVIVECGFLSNPDEETLLCDDAYQDRLAAAICQGILEYYKSMEVSP